MSIVVKLTDDRCLILERKNFVLVHFPKDGDSRIVPIKLREGLSIQEETITPQGIWICYKEAKEGESLSDHIEKAFNSVKEAVESLTDSSCWGIYHIYRPLYETEEEVVWLGARYEAKEVKIQTTREVNDG